jgi:hypothetical protein
MSAVCLLVVLALHALMHSGHTTRRQVADFRGVRLQKPDNLRIG